MFKDKLALKEAISDTVIGTVINFPLNMLAMWIIFKAQLTVFQSSVLLWAIFTSIAVVRKYTLRIYFKNNKKKVDNPVS